MKVVALISGGKDSTFNMMKCVERGHEIVALANLYPPPGKEELDSYMYQSVGHDAIDAYSQCLPHIPLYRREIRGTPINQAYDYIPTEEDEVECLYELLCEVKSKHPDLEGVSSGAIRSTYQKNRVENICGRLGLVSLAYLWEADQPSLLQSMIDSGLHAIIVKVAAYGLDSGDLGKNLAQLKPKLMDLSVRYGVNVCGEGGEFESLTLDCPLFKKRLVIEETEMHTHKDGATVSVSFLKIKKWHLEDKSCSV